MAAKIDKNNEFVSPKNYVEKTNSLQLAEMANGALQELFENDLEKVIENINDPNTSAKKARKITFELKFVPVNEERELVNVDITSKTTLAPAEGITTNVVISTMGGNPIAVEYGNQMSGQLNFNDYEEEEEAEENPYKSNILQFKTAK